MASIGKARVPSEGELKRLFTLARTGQHGKRNFALLQFSFRLGMRAGELAALRIRDCVDDQETIRDELSLKAAMCKGGKPRELFLTNHQVRSALKNYLDDRRKREGMLFNVDAPLFESQKGNGFSPNTMQQLFHRLFATAGVDGARSHSGRRYFATELISKGVDIKSVSVLMGHSSVQMTAQYADSNPQKLRRILADMI